MENRVEWEKKIPEATTVMMAWLSKTYPGIATHIRFNHVDASGYWFEYQLVIDDRRQTWCVRHSDLEG